ncbi:MAG: hypothetical protein C4337_08840 [Armatimonadota bacterium]
MLKGMKRWLWLWWTLVCSVVWAQMPDLRFPVEVALERAAYTPNSTVQGVLVIRIPQPYHVNANPASEDYLIPTELRVPKGPHYTLGKVEYPKALEKTFEFAGDKPLKIYEGVATIRFELRLATSAPKGDLPIKASVRYQACDDKACYPPQTVPSEFKIRIADKMGDLNPRYKALTESKDSETPPAGSLRENSQQANRFALWVEQQFQQGRWGLFVLGLYVAGLALNLTPCVLPLIPITLGFFSMQSRGLVGRRVGLSALYTLSMAAVYSGLGTVASLVGKKFGFQFQNPLVTGVLIGLLVLFALALFGVYKFQVPPSVMRYVGVRQGWMGALMMGGVAGIAAAPCIGPVIAALIPIVAALGNPTVGFLLFLALGLGLGTPYFVLGLFHDRLQSRLPRSGEWTILVERVFGILLLAVALFFASSLLPQQVYQWSWIVFWVGVALYLWFGERKEITQRSVVRLKQVLGMVFVWLALSNTYSLMKPKVEIVWEPYSDAKVVQAQRERKPVIIDFTATWCIACGELKEYTFTAPAVVKESARFVRLVVDATRESDPEVVRVTRQYEVVGLPTVIFIGSDGQERRALRLTGFEPARDFLKRMRQVQ